MEEELNKLNFEDKENFILKMFNLFEDSPTFEIIGEGKNNIATAKVYTSSNNLKDRLNMQDINFKVIKNTKNQTIISTTFKAHNMETTIDYNLKIDGIELNPEGLLDFMNKYSHILIEKDLKVSSPEEALELFNNIYKSNS